MPHPSEGVLRRLLDEPSGVAVADRQHVDRCTRCLADLDLVRADADLVRASLSVATPQDVDVSAAWERLSAASGAPAPGRGPVRQGPPRAARRTSWLQRPSVAAVGFAVVLAGAGTAAANDWLKIFGTERVAPVSISARDLVSLPDLSAYGELAFTAAPDVREVSDATTAQEQTGVDVPEVAELPRGVDGRPVYQVGDQVSATFVFRTDRAARAAAGAGEPLPSPPPGLDGSAVRLVAGPGVAQLWSSDAGVPALIVGRAVAPTASSSGVPFDVVRDYLLALPGLSDDVAEQLRTFAADGSTLPIPVPEDELTSRATSVGGAPATLLTTRDRTLAAVVWVEEGVVTVVAGSLDDEEVLSVARTLR